MEFKQILQVQHSKTCRDSDLGPFLHISSLRLTNFLRHKGEFFLPLVFLIPRVPRALRVTICTSKINNTSIYPARRWWQQQCVSSAGFSQPDARQGYGSPLDNVPRFACICYTMLVRNLPKSYITPVVCQ